MFEYEKFILVAIPLLALAMFIHEFGHLVACAYLGLEPIAVDWVGAKVNCALSPGGPHPLTLAAGGGLAAIMFVAPTTIRQVRRRGYLFLALVVVILTQGLNGMLETLAYEVYVVANLAHLLVLPFALIMLIILSYKLKHK